MEVADQRYWRLYQFAFVGLRNTSDVAHTQSGEKLGLSSNVAVVHRLVCFIHNRIYLVLL